MLSPEISHWLNTFIASCGQANEVWLIGSRANNSFTETSDWDFIAFATPNQIGALNLPSSQQRADVDMLVTFDGDNFKSAWGEDKSGSLSSWEWRKTSDGVAVYQSVKWLPDEEVEFDSKVNSKSSGLLVTNMSNAYRVWARKT